MTRSGYDEPEPDHNPDWVLRDEKFATIDRRDFVQVTFQPIPALASRTNPGHWRRYHGQPFDEAEWELVEGMWDHEHCDVCFAHIEPGMTYWSSKNDTFLCDMCYDRYLQAPGIA
jgi:hypothetical protein